MGIAFRSGRADQGRTPSSPRRSAVPVELGEAFRAETPQPLFDDAYRRNNSAAFGTPNYDIMPDGQSFVMVSPVLGSGVLRRLAKYALSSLPPTSSRS